VLTIDNLEALPVFARGSVVTMGDFDGLHPGHRALIQTTIDRAHALGIPSILVTYEPSPKKIMKKLAHDSRLTTLAEKKIAFAESKLDYAVFYPITQATLQKSARTFLREFLLAKLNMRAIVIGDDHHFGHNRRGNSAYLSAAAKRYGFEVDVIAEQISLSERASSTRIRNALATGDVRTVAALLGRPYTVSGSVVHGEARGRTIGFPTANIAFDREKLLPAKGVFAGFAALENGARIPAVANLGNKPTAGDYPIGLEVHLLDFDGNLYGQSLLFEFWANIRLEKKFANLEALQAQIALDIATARKILSTTRQF